jgi:hypothetical protein
MPPGSPPEDEPPEPQAQRSEVGLATIALRQIRVNRADVQEKPTSADANPMNLLVPYLDLYGRLTDEELARLADVPASVVSNLRRQVVQVDRALARFTDLLPRLNDAELVRLTGATAKTIRFWRLCQPRFPMAGTDAQGWSVAQAADALGRLQSSVELSVRRPPTGPHQAAAMSDEPPLESGMPLEPRHPSGEVPRYGRAGETANLPRHPSGEFPRVGASASRMPTAEREGGSPAYRMPTAEREGGSPAYRMPTAEREGGSSAHRTSTAERDTGSWSLRTPPAEREGGSSAHRMATAERDTASAPYRMSTAEREGGRRTFEPPPMPTSSASRTPGMPSSFPVDLSRPRTGRTEEMPAVAGSPPPVPPIKAQPPPEVVQKQQAVAQQMGFSGAPFPGYDSEASGRMSGEDDGIFIGLELPDPRTLPQHGRRE